MPLSKSCLITALNFKEGTMEKSLKDLKAGDYVQCRRSVRKFVRGELYKVQKSSKEYLKITSGMTHEAHEKKNHTIYLVTPSGGLCSIFEEPLEKYFEYCSSKPKFKVDSEVEFKLPEPPLKEGVEMAKHLREVLDDMSQFYNGNHEKIMIGFAGYLAGIIKGDEL